MDEMSSSRPSSPFRSFEMSSVRHGEFDIISANQSYHGLSSRSFEFNRENEEMELDDDDESDVDLKRKKSGDKKKRSRKRKVISDSDDENNDSAAEEKEEPNAVIYCICRTSDMDRFMICCDNCEEWFHGDCVKVTQAYSKKIEKYYCQSCREKDSSLEVKLKEPYASRERAKKEKASRIEQNRIIKEEAFEKENNLPFDIKIKQRKENESEEERDNYSPEEDDDEEEDDDDEFKVTTAGEKTKRKYRTKGRPRKSNEKGKSKAKQRGRKKGQSTKTKETKGRGRRKNVTKKSHEHHRRGRHKTQSEDEQDELKSNAPRHCFGPECINAARKGSKYCSDECGVRLATNRLMEILPQRIIEWQSEPCAADQLSVKELEEIRREQNHASVILADIDRKQVELDILIEQGKNCVPYSEEESTEIEDNEPDSDYAIHCITCSQEVSLKIALKHMERCFNKVESQTSFCSAIQPNVECQKVFCDVYNPIQRTYCKRLRVLCPEHSKETRINEDEVCGCPLRSETDPFSDQIDSFCRLLRKKCNRHYGWEKSRQAVLDAQRIQQWLKLDELMEKEQKTRQRMSRRHGVVPLLLHRTSKATEAVQ